MRTLKCKLLKFTKILLLTKKFIQKILNSGSDMKIINLSIFGDNILECERMVQLISSSFPELIENEQQLNPIYAPTKRIFNTNLTVSIQLFPDYKSSDRWGDKSILTLLEEKGAKLTEAPDVILTESIDGIETILLAIEFSSAIPAGNQAWQRSGRALSFSEVNIPYLYITDIGLEELDSNRESKAVRESNPLVPLSYVKNSQRSDSFTYVVFNPSYLLEDSEELKDFIVKDEVLKIIRGLILKENISCYEEQLENKIANYLDHYENVPTTISFKKWIEKKDIDIESYIESFNLKKYNKKIATKTPIKEEMKLLIKDIIPDYALSIYNNLPICFVPSSNREKLKNKIKSSCYPLLNDEVYTWLGSNKPMVICLVNGFKPRGDDSRPDRGLVPLARMLFGNNVDIMSLVFGQATASMQNNYANTPIQLASRNGLWKSVLYYSSLTIANSAHWSLSQSKLEQFQLSNADIDTTDQKSISFSTPSRTPTKFKENDIDTAIHLTFSSQNYIFESLCNPPGGDWSGISFLDKDDIEHRWMSLPRVSDESKRPDHIFQFKHNDDTYILIIESKEKLSGLLSDKEELGQSLIDYVTSLIAYQSSAINIDCHWNKSDNNIPDISVTEYITAASFFYTKEEELTIAINELQVDFIIAFNLSSHNIIYKNKTQKGKFILEFFKNNGTI